MNSRNEKMKIGILTFAVGSALAAMFALPPAAQADDEVTAALKSPDNFVEIGAMDVNHDSAKFGEYNGLEESGVYGIANIQLRGGDAYAGGDGTMRWEIEGSDLGTTSRELSGSVGNQGLWDLSISYDQLRHHISDTYQTPQQGSMGGDSFTMPANFGTVNGGADPSTRVLDATQLGAFHREDVYTERKNTSFSAGYTFSPQISLEFDYNHLDQDGAKLIGSSATGGIATPLGGTWRGEANNILMNPTDYKTDTFNLALNWVGEKGHATVGYYGSIFRDANNSLTWENALSSNGTAICASGGACSYQTNTMSTAPDNSLHQFNLTGGYAFSPATKLSGSFSYGRNTQDDRFLSGQPEIVLSPRSSFNGKVITTHADLKLTHQLNKDLGLSAGFKYNERDNKSPSNLYQFFAINNVTAVDAAANAPYSNRRTQYELAADYRLSKGQNVRVAYERENIKRWCDDYAISGANCLVNPSNDEDKLGISYRLKAREDVSFKAGYTYARRDADFEGNAITPLAGLNTLTPDDVNALNYPGYIAHPYAKRDQHQVNAGINWQAIEKLELGLNTSYKKDDYDTTLGVQDGRTMSVNLDATYAYSDNSSISAYASWQNSERNLKSACNHTVVGVEYCHIIGGDNTGSFEASSYDALVAPANNWTNRLEDDSNAIGINARQKGLMGGKLEIIGDLSYSLDKTHYSTKVPYDANCGTSAKLTCGDTPDIRTKIITLKLSGNYQINKNGKVALGYIYQKLDSDDYYYNGYQYGFTANRVMPTNEQAPNYSVGVITASYIYSF